MNSPRQPGSRRAPILTAIVAIAIAAIYLLNTNLLGVLMPDLVGANGSGAGTMETSTDGAPPPLTAPPAASEPATEAVAGATDEAQPAPAATMPARMHGVPTIAYAELPPEALETIALIEQGGPFPYDKDGAVFQNREGILPGRPSGYYREYTVETPGSDDRGARRIVEGGEGALYYTDDHYASFRYVWRGGE